MNQKLYWLLCFVIALCTFFIFRVNVNAQIVETSSLGPYSNIHEDERWIIRQAAMNPAFTGAWREHTPSYLMIIAFASADYETILEPYLSELTRPDLVEVVYREYSLSELSSIDEEIFSILGKKLTEEEHNQFIYGGAIDNRNALIEIRTPDPEWLRSKLETI